MLINVQKTGFMNDEKYPQCYCKRTVVGSSELIALEPQAVFHGIIYFEIG